ncbi:uncharacterized protein [Aegilops tauschii subsp. strangulata]|uniref:Uncharacterized protein n=1 Tax=Aegilops tauschii subsp. strangulata TaxID=200361 RepID=A0A453DF47_AEGTS|nr:uncharacterized protein LOC109783543 [Aegilops tauschii subsp. strangulata]
MGDEFEAFSEEELRRRPEVRIINKYALTVAYIRFALKSIGALLLLWATVVLLGGFVSSLKRVDFWYLTTIAFLQAAGVFDVMGDARFAFFEDWLDSLMQNVESYHLEHTQLRMRQWLKRKLHMLIDIILIVIFLPAVYFALAGPVLCIVLSAIRVANQGYGIADGETSKANLNRALDLYYYVSLAHGTICLLCMLSEVTANEVVVVSLWLRHGFSLDLLDGYLRETKQMCVHNPASIMNWNLITYGASLLDSQSPEDYVAGGRVLTMLIDQGMPLSIRRLMIRSPRERIQKMRWLAARIVEHLAADINLTHFPGALECISSLFDTSCHNNGDQEALHLPFVIGHSKQKRRISLLDRVVAATLEGLLNSRSFQRQFRVQLIRRYVRKQQHNSEDLVLPGLRILENLAHDTHNCTLIYNTKGLLSKIVAPVSSNEFVQDTKSSAAWTKVVDGSLKVVSRLMSSSGSTGIKMHRLIANNSNAVKNLEAILDMDMKSKSGIIKLQTQALEVLTQLTLHHPASTSAEKLIKKALHIFLTADWMRDYLEHEKRNIDQPTTIQQNMSLRPSMRSRLSNLIKKANGAWAREKMAEQAAKERVEKKMKEAQETAIQHKEKAGEALARISSDSEAIKSFTGGNNDVLGLTELLDSNIKTIKCEISATDSVEIKINTGCRISAEIILKHLRNYDKETTLRKVLAELIPIQAEASSASTPRWCGHANSCSCLGNGIENGAISCVISFGTGVAAGCFPKKPSDGEQDKPSASLSYHIQQCWERRLQAELLSLVAGILANGNYNFAEVLISPPASDSLLEDFVMRLKKMVEDNSYATPACLAIQKLICEMVTGFLQHDGYVEVIDKHNIVATLLEASEVMDCLESSMLFSGVDHDCHGVPLKPLSSVLAKNSEDLLAQRKQALGINIVPVSAAIP